MDFKKIVYFFLIVIPIVALGEIFHFLTPTLALGLAAVGLIPLAGLLGEATEELAIHTGPRIGGLLNATLGNAAELIITIVALQKGLVELVKASITGSILGNLLLILGASLLLGGLKNGTQHFDRRVTGLAATQMTLAIIALAIPTLFVRSIGDASNVLTLSKEVGAVMILLYGLYLVYSFTHESEAPHVETGIDHNEPHVAKWTVPVASGILVAATLGVVFLSEVLVGSVEEVVAAWGLSEFFLGIILIPLVGNVAEHLVGVTAAYKNKMELSLAISLGSSMQIALFVAPLLVFISLFVGPGPMNLVFTNFELIALAASSIIATFASQDGESNWLEGAQLLAVYVMFAFGFFFI
ncbi:MAG: calcium/proton exchanger [Ardenticatenales bacterium]|nr:calcium/proton exchanger [Ardenticatenales bacterium]